uniref:High affinity sulfate transporter 2 n=1 Tax=Cajanus cajan TaxID=3821 RepID=A0A151T0F0_CAJCA|nr:High affinity sulfate transporter 2 [Cajanus cajan]
MSPYQAISNIQTLRPQRITIFQNSEGISLLDSPLQVFVSLSSRRVAIGPVAVVYLLLGTMLSEEISDYHSHEYLRLVFTATFFAGITQMALGLLRLGFLLDFLSHADIVGFMGGAVITISLQQLKGLHGIQKFTKKTDIVSVMSSVFSPAHHGWNWQTIIIGLSFLVN